MKLNNKTSMSLAAAMGALALATSANAATITVANPSFETGTVAPAGWGPDDWTRDGGTAAGRYDAASSSGQSGTDGPIWLWVINPRKI